MMNTLALTLWIMSMTLLFASGTLYAQNSAPEPGDRAPSFEAVSDDGSVWKSDEHIGESILVVYFYPAAMTGGCTDQACNFRDNRTKLTELGAEVVGISGDQPESLEIFKRFNNLNFPLLSDPQGEIAQSFGVPVRDGGTFTAVVDGQEIELERSVTTARWTFIIDIDGNIAYKDTEVQAAGDSEAVIAALERMKAE
jgi:thioredoxin-dependent peroxiredoxin